MLCECTNCRAAMFADLERCFECGDLDGNDRLVLRVAEGSSLREHEIPDIGALSIGRAPSSDIRLADRRVSRSHLRVNSAAGTVWVEDAGAANVTTVNGIILHKPMALRVGDCIQVPSATLTLVKG